MINVRRVLAVLLSFAGTAVAFAATPARPPNIIFFLSDDLAQGDVGVYKIQFPISPRPKTGFWP